MKKKASRPAAKSLPKPRKAALSRKAAPAAPLERVDESALLSDLRILIQSARQRVAVVANSTTTLLYWHLGRRLLTENLQDRRAEYGKRILATVSQELTAELGQGFTLRALYRSIQFCESFAVQEIVSALSTQLSWSHFLELLPVKEPLSMNSRRFQRPDQPRQIRNSTTPRFHVVRSVWVGQLAARYAIRLKRIENGKLTVENLQ